jgi:hypothetical protein
VHAVKVLAIHASGDVVPYDPCDRHAFIICNFPQLNKNVYILYIANCFSDGRDRIAIYYNPAASGNFVLYVSGEGTFIKATNY